MSAIRHTNGTPGNGSSKRCMSQSLLSMFQCFVDAGTFWCLRQQTIRTSRAWHLQMQASLHC